CWCAQKEAWARRAVREGRGPRAGISHRRLIFRRTFRKGLTGGRVGSAATGYLFPSLHDHVDILGIEFNEPRAPACSLGGNERAARSAEGIEHDVAALA